MADSSEEWPDGAEVPDTALSSAVAKRLGSRVRELRETLELTQEALAAQAGITKNHLQLLERGWVNRQTREPANPRLETLAGLARALGVRIDIRYVGEELYVELVSEV